MTPDERKLFIAFSMGIATSSVSNPSNSQIVKTLNKMLQFGKQEVMTEEEENYLELMQGLIFEFRITSGTNRKQYRKIIYKK